MDRQPLTIVEIDLEQCGLTYGAGACTALLGVTGQHKCFGGYKHCQVRSAFLKTVKTIRFAQNVSGLPGGVHLYPCLKSVSTRSAEINLSGVDPNSTALGVRAKVTVNLLDFADSDLSIDPYADQRRSGAAQADGIGYDPMDRSTFLRKLKVRFPFWNARPLRVLTGYVGDALEDMTTRHYVISDWTGPDASGACQIVAKDVFDLTEDEKAVIPTLSRGKLKDDIDANATSLVLEPETVGAEYAAAGRICVGSEVMTFTRSGDVLTVARGADGTNVATHGAGDLAQQCERITGTIPAAIHHVLTVGDAGPVPADWIDLAEWETEAVGWLGGIEVRATITAPKSRRKLVGELCQLGALIWPDQVARKIRFRANRPIGPGETAHPLSDDGSFVEATGGIGDDTDQRISRVFFWHGQMDVTKDPTGGENTRRGAIQWNQASEGPLQYGESMIEEIATRWFGTEGNDSAASTIAERLGSRYEVTPQTFEGSIDHNDGKHLALGDICEVTTRLIVDEVGVAVPTLMQIQALEESVPGHRWKVKLQTFTFAGNFAFWMLSGAPDYDAATDPERDEGAYWIDQAAADFGDGRSPYVWF